MPITLEDFGTANSITCDSQKTIQTKIIIKGNNNTIAFGQDCSVQAGEIFVNGDDNVLNFGVKNRFGNIRAIVQDNSTLKFGELCSVEQAYFLARDGRSIIFGNGCMISFQVDIRTSDAHGIWKAGTFELINSPGDVIVKDNVWICQGAMISKNTTIHSNSIIGMKSFVQNQTIPGNVVMAGTPAKLIHEDIEWTRHIDIETRKKEIKTNSYYGNPGKAS